MHVPLKLVQITLKLRVNWNWMLYKLENNKFLVLLD
jgi:hypothetical protein